MRRLIAPLVVALTVACHNGGAAFSPTGPTGAPTDTNGLPSGSTGSASAVTLVSGETGLPVAGARVLVSGQPYTSDPAGRVLLSGMPFASSELDIQATGYLERQTALSASSHLLTLWPRLSPTGLDEEAVP